MLFLSDTQTIPKPQFLTDLDDLEFSNNSPRFSSFAYRVACTRNLGEVMRMQRTSHAADERVAILESRLTRWRLQLPAPKRTATHGDGSSDEMIFQACMITHATSILLHEPFSRLDTTSIQSIDSCAPQRTAAAAPGRAASNMHTSHMTASAAAISDMITHPHRLTSHTHFFVCVIVLSSMVHLSQWALLPPPPPPPPGGEGEDGEGGGGGGGGGGGDDDALRQRVSLNIAALNRFAEVWEAAGVAREQVRAVARRIYQAKRQQQFESRLWEVLMEDDGLHLLGAGVDDDGGGGGGGGGGAEDLHQGLPGGPEPGGSGT